ncbi:MAG TPA: hypothetical protein VEA59_03085, partial [Patescibacteria group bacterium]|nr:hypothetical protein [Patescibacteria group bacterium]
MKLVLLPDEALKLTQKQYTALPFVYVLIMLVLQLLPLVYFGFDFSERWFYRLWTIFVAIVALRMLVVYIRTVLIITTQRIIYVKASGYIMQKTLEVPLEKIANITTSMYAPFMHELQIFP